MKPPVVFVTCSQSREAGFLTELQGEMHGIWRAMFNSDSERIIDLQEPPYDADATILLDRVNPLADRLAVFHYSGHANGHFFKTQNEEYSNDQLVALLSNWCPKLVFLNGCSTYGHVDFLLERGVKAVIATSTKVKDSQARLFSVKFYEVLAENKTLGQAFTLAKSVLTNASEVKTTSRPKMGWGTLSTEKKAELCPWGLYHTELTDDYNNDATRISILDWLLIKPGGTTGNRPKDNKPLLEKIEALVKERAGKEKDWETKQALLGSLQGLSTPDTNIQNLIQKTVLELEALKLEIRKCTEQIIESKKSYKAGRLRTNDLERVKDLLPKMRELNYREPRKKVLQWLDSDVNQVAPSFILQGTDQCGLHLLQNITLKSIEFGPLDIEFCERYLIDCNTSTQEPITETAIWQKINRQRGPERSVDEQLKPDTVREIFAALKGPDIDLDDPLTKNFLMVIRNAHACTDFTFIQKFWDTFCEQLQRQNGWAEWSRKNKAVLIVRYEPTVDNYNQIKEVWQRQLDPFSTNTSYYILPPVGLLPYSEIEAWRVQIAEFGRIKIDPFKDKETPMLAALKHFAKELELDQLYNYIETETNPD